MALHLNLLVVIGANLPPEVLGDVWPLEEETAGKLHQALDCESQGQLPHQDFGIASKGPPSAPPSPSSLSPPLGALPLYASPPNPPLGAVGVLPAADFQDLGNNSPSCSSRTARANAPGEPAKALPGELLEEASQSSSSSGVGSNSGATPSSSSSSSPSSSMAPLRRRRGPIEARTPEEEACQRACPGMVVLPRRIVDQGIHFDRDGPRRGEPGKVILVMSYDNIAALCVILSLSILGAIYLWKICTRRRCLCRICQNQYRQLHLIGSGGYGSVYLVERLNDGVQFVSKKILVRDITEVDEYSKEAKELVTLRHRHIVSYEEDFVHVEYGALEPKTYFIIVMEFCPEGDLKEKIEQDFCAFTEEWVRTVFAQLLQAVQYLHSKNVIHRDLKSQNVFLAEDGHVRLGDFGLCRHTRSPALGSATFSHAGTDCYMAPEMLSSSRYGKPADMWSLGCVLYELCTGQFMWELDGILGAMVMTDARTVQALLHTNLVPAVGSTLRSLLRRLLSIKPEARPTATACIRKKLFKRAFPVSREPFGDQLEQGPGDGGAAPAQEDTSPEGLGSEPGSLPGSLRKSGASASEGPPEGGSDEEAAASDAEEEDSGEGEGGEEVAETSEEEAALQRTESALARRKAQRRRRRTYRR